MELTKLNAFTHYWVLLKNLSDCAEFFGVSEETFRRRLIAMGIPRRPKTVNFGGWNKGESLSAAQRKKISRSRKRKFKTGEIKHWNAGNNWSADVRKKISDGLLKGREPAESYYGPGWHIQRTSRLQMDNYSCQQCGNTERIEVHHWEPFRFSYDNSLENLVTLCFDCHREKHVVYRDEGWTQEAERDFYGSV